MYRFPSPVNGTMIGASASRMSQNASKVARRSHRLPLRQNVRTAASKSTPSSSYVVSHASRIADMTDNKDDSSSSSSSALLSHGTRQLQQHRTMLDSAHSHAELRDEPSDSQRRSWQAEHNLDIQRVTQTAIVHELTQQQTRSIERVVPWFLNTMPEGYFRQVPESFRLDHIKAISAIKDANMDMHMNLRTHLPDGRQVLTFIRPGTMPGLLLSMMKELPFNQRTKDYIPLSRVQVFSAEDDSMSLNVFVYGEEANSTKTDVELSGSHILEYASQLQSGELGAEDKYGRTNPPSSDMYERENILAHMEMCSESYVTRSDPRRFLHQMDLFSKVSGTDGIAVGIEESHIGENEEKHYWVDLALANTLPHFAVEQTARLLFLHNLDVIRAHLDNVSDGENGTVTILRMLVNPVNGAKGDPETFKLLKRELKRCKWLTPSTMELVYEKQPWLGVIRGEIITGMCTIMHPIMSKVNALAFSKGNIFDTVTKDRCINHAADIADLFLDRFHPERPLADDVMEARAEELRKTINNSVEETHAQELLFKMIDIVRHTFRTNVYMKNRYSLGFRLDPRIMITSGSEPERDLPYGVFFVHGRRFDAYHVRFRDIARGGLRLVTPASPEQFALESAHQYDECYGLAYAQQLKNKDIPEGGSKAVALIDTIGLSASGKNFVMRKAVKAFADTILDLIVDTEETRENVVDFLGKKEVLYLGPDEQVIPEDINYVIKRAAQRGYGTPSAFMSSKPRAGINHKVYGVTSEGVNVFLEESLRHVLNIDPKKESFTLKMTGGPDGDVAGNELKILYREYGENAKVVGIADHSGCAEDPNGLNWEELLRLVNDNLSCEHFDPAALSEEGVVHTVDSEEGVKARNSMHNRIRADAFVPAGGRPNTIDIHNYKQFLTEDGTPSAPLIVEGANLFVTDEARKALFDEAGVVIVKDSSANKCGVITSSYEICAAMLLSEEEFFENKDAIVNEVLEKLRSLARLEAQLLFREFERYGGSLPDASKVISGAVNAATDALAIALETLSAEDREQLLPLFRAHLPKTMADIAFDHVHERVPEQYITNAIASCLASKLVYKEGTKFIDSQPKEKLAQIALKYLEKEREVAALMEALEGTDMPQKEKVAILELLEVGGARAGLNIFEKGNS